MTGKTKGSETMAHAEHTHLNKHGAEHANQVPCGARTGNLWGEVRMETQAGLELMTFLTQTPKC